MGVIATVGSFYDRMRESLKFSELRRSAVTERSNATRAQARQSAKNRKLPHGVSDVDFLLDAVAQRAVDNDGVVKTLIGDEQWGARLATTYGVAHIASLMVEVRDALLEIKAQQAHIARMMTRVANNTSKR